MAATEDDVELVVIDGRPRYGTPELMAGRLDDHRHHRQRGGPMKLSLSQPSDDHRGLGMDGGGRPDGGGPGRPEARDRGGQRHVCAAGPGELDDVEAPLRLALDMPTGLAPVGGLPKDLDQIDVPPLQSLTHDADWLDSLPGRGFHGGVLDGLAWYYRA